jgi:hypothetical protein
VTPLEFIRMRLEEAEKEPITPAESMLIDAVCALSDVVESLDTAANSDMRRWCWIATYAAMQPSAHRQRAINAAREAVEDFDAFFAGEVRR